MAQKGKMKGLEMRFIKNLIWEVKYRICKKHQYHIVRTQLKPGYYDIDEILLSASFTLLCRFVEKEHSGVNSIIENRNWYRAEGHEDHAKNYDEVISLYNWWKYGRPADYKHEEELLSKAYSGQIFERSDLDENGNRTVKIIKPTDEVQRYRDQLNELQKRIYDDENNNLIRLMNIRRSLWT